MMFFVHDLTNRIKSPIKPTSSFQPVENIKETHGTKPINSPPEPTHQSPPKVRQRTSRTSSQATAYNQTATASDIMSSPLLTCYLTDELASILEKMNKHGTHHIVVLGDEDIINGLTSLERIYKQQSLSPSTTLEEAHLLPVISTPSNTPSSKIASIMLEQRIESILVIDGDFVEGIITATNFLKLAADDRLSVDSVE